MNILKNKVLITGFFFGLCFLFSGFFFPVTLFKGLSVANNFILSVFKDYYLYFGLFIVLIALVLLCHPFSKGKLGSQSVEYSFFSWIAMLYSTGMGSGLLLRAVQEPAYYYTHPPVATNQAQVNSLQFSFFHWGLTPWAFYSLFGLIVAYNLYIKKANSFRTAIAGDLTNKKLSSFINLYVVLITIVGVVASLGLGSGQFIGGVNSYFNIHLGNIFLMFTVFLIGIVALISALTGINKVFKLMANFDMIGSILLMFFIAFQLDFSSYIINTSRAVGNYLLYFIAMSTASGNYKTSDTFIQNWTVFYWAFWIAWVPFTGIFIARISRGRTIREYIIATILIPFLATLIWFSIFGNKTFELIGVVGDYKNQYDSIYTSLFSFLREFPLSKITVFLTALLVLTSIINSVDSAIFVLGIFSDQGKADPRKSHKIIWSCIIVFTALGIIALGNENLLDAISSLLIIMALPFSFLYGYLLIRFLKDIFLKKSVG